MLASVKLLKRRSRRGPSRLVYGIALAGLFHVSSVALIDDDSSNHVKLAEFGEQQCNTVFNLMSW